MRRVAALQSKAMRARSAAATLVLALLALLAALPPAAQAAEVPLAEIEWQLFSLPPLYILDGPAKSQGVLDQGLTQQLLPRMPQWRHRFTEVPIKRLEATLKMQPNACAFGLLKNPAREAFMLFSQPFLTQIPPGVMVRRSELARLQPHLDGRGLLQLQSALADPGLRLGVAEGRSYGAQVDALVAAARSRHGVQAVAASTPGRNLLQMLQHGRIEAALMLPFEARYLELTEGLDPQGLQFLAVAEQPSALHGHAACAKGPLGERVIQRVNEILALAEVQAALDAYYERWLDDDTRALVKALRKSP